MRGLSLFITLAFAHLVVLADRDIAASVWALPAYLWQDAAAALLFGVFAHLAKRPRIVWPIYGAVVAYAALNVAVARVLPSPLTPSMLRAARGTLTGSMAEYVTVPNVLVCSSVLIVGALTPLLLRHCRFRPQLLAALAVATVSIGSVASSRVETDGWHRNAFGALLPDRLPAAVVEQPPGGWRHSPFGSAIGTDLSELRGVARGRNVVLVILESTGALYLRPYGAGEDPMPNLTKLSETSVLFESAYAAYPESIKGLFAALCSRHPGLDVPVEAHANAECRALPRLLQDAGYQTGLFHSGRFSYLGMRDIVEDTGLQVLADAGTLSGRHNSSFGIDEATTVEAMLSWVDARESDRPFFLVYLPIAGHHPYVTTSPGPYPPIDEHGRYLNALHEADRALERLLAGIQQRGLDEQTLYVIFGDHSEAFEQHPGNVGHSFFLYEENVRIPYLIAAPGLLTATTRASQTMSVIDTAPTLLDLLGVPIPRSFEGASALNGRARMAFFVTDYAQRWLGLVDGCWKLHFRVDDRSRRLFDVCSDPSETRDLAVSEAARADVYTQRLIGWAQAVRSGLLEGPALD